MWRPSALSVLLAIAVGQAVAGPHGYAPHLHPRNHEESIAIEQCVVRTRPYFGHSLTTVK